MGIASVDERAELQPGSEDRVKAGAGPRGVAKAPAIIVTVIVAAIVGLSLWYLAQPQPLVIQGEADATRIDIAARVDGRVATRPVERGDNPEWDGEPQAPEPPGPPRPRPEAEEPPPPPSVGEEDGDGGPPRKIKIRLADGKERAIQHT